MPAFPSFPILVSSSEVVLDQRAEGSAPLKNLVKGQTVTARVLRVVSDRQALLMVNGQKVSAKTFLPLQSGQTIMLRVEQAGARQVLKFLGRPEDVTGIDHRILVGSFGKARPYMMLSRIFEALNHPSEAGADHGHSRQVALMKNLSAALSLRSSVPMDRFLKRLIKGSGLLWESKLAAALLKGELAAPGGIDRFVAGDLKALALQLMAGAEALPGQLSEQLGTFLEGIEQHQLLNQHLMDSSGRCLLPMPVLWPSALKFGQLLIDLGNKKAGDRSENQMMTVSFLLSLSRLGELRADFSVLKKGITGVFGVADEKARELIRPHLPELRQKLQAHGFVVYDISCQVLPPERLTEMSLVDQAVAPSRDGFLNLVI